MKKIKLCCFTVNSTHACIIANNFINNELKNVKVIYINEKSEKRKLKNIISRFYKKMDDKVNKYLDINESVGYIINCYDIFDITESTKEIINSHDYYINTTGIVKNETSTM